MSDPRRPRGSFDGSILALSLTLACAAAPVSSCGGTGASPARPVVASAPAADAAPAAPTPGPARPVVVAGGPAWRGAVPADWPHALDAPVVSATRGMVSSDAALATRAGVGALEQGGNAVDAAVATAFALAVVYPQAGNLGGGGFLVHRTASGETAALDFRETAPARATRDMFLDDKGQPSERSITGHLAAGVPGSVSGLWEAHRKYGKLPWRDLVEPAIRLAEDGFAVDAAFAAAIAREAERLRRFPASAALFLPGGAPPAVGSVWKNPDLGAALRRISDKGPAGFYQGRTAELLVAEMRRGKGILSKKDLAAYRAKWRAPIEVTYRGATLILMPPPSSGGVVVALLARILEPTDLAALGWHSPAHLHLLAEASRRGFAARNRYLGDPDHVEVALGEFLGEEAAARRRATISPTRATPSAEIEPQTTAAPGGGLHTTHLSVVAADGSAVALTTTINTGFGAAVTVQGAGFLLNNEMDDFATAPGKPNVFGLVQGEANAVQPGKRMLSSMTPTIVVAADGRVQLVTGAAGGPTIISATFQVLSNVLDFGMDVRAAVAAPRIHHQHLPDVLFHEDKGLVAETRAALEALGHAVEVRRAGRIGDAPSILRRGSTWTGSAEPRQEGGLAAGL